MRVGRGRVRSGGDSRPRRPWTPRYGSTPAGARLASGRQPLRTVQRLAASLAGGPIRYADESATTPGLYAVPVVRSGQRAGTVVAGLSLVPYERTASRALTASIIFAGATLLVIVAAAGWIVGGGALRPVAPG